MGIVLHAGPGGICGLLQTPTADAHRSGCHRWHSCPSDSGSYVCGDLGISTYCPNQPPTDPPSQPPSTNLPPSSPAPSRPTIDWHTYETAPELRFYWQANGGLSVFGYAKSVTYTQDGHLTQIFERNRLEYHPENPRPYDIQVGLLGEERLIQLGRIWQNEPRATPQPGCRYFAETGHNVCGRLLAYWKSHGLEFDKHRGLSEVESLALFGYPVTENENGVQWFQRARLEDHGGEGVLLGLLGNEVYGTP